MQTTYGAILSTVFVTMFYGFFLPLLFPICAFTFMNYYIMEKLMVTYYYQRPPMYDEKLNKSALSILRWAPVFFFFMGYWALGNKQIYENTVRPITYSVAPVNTGHTGAPYVGPDLPIFIVALVYLFALIFESLLESCLIHFKCKDPEEPDEVDEKLGNYWECVASTYRKKWLAEEIYNSNQLNIRTLGIEAVEKMRTFVGNKRVIRTTPNYDILSNPVYQTLF